VTPPLAPTLDQLKKDGKWSSWSIKEYNKMVTNFKQNVPMLIAKLKEIKSVITDTHILDTFLTDQHSLTNGITTVSTDLAGEKIEMIYKENLSIYITRLDQLANKLWMITYIEAGTKTDILNGLDDLSNLIKYDLRNIISIFEHVTV
jgi:hypothetical protein